MKKNFTIFVVTFLMLFLVSLNVVKADCPTNPPGWEQHTVTAVYSYNSGGYAFTCNITIVFCCYWNNNLKRVISQIDYDFGTNNHCIDAIPNETDFNNWLHQIVGYWASIYCSPSFPPCDDPNQSYYEVSVSSSLCWYYENWQPYLGDDYVLRKVKCGDKSNYCMTIWRVCMDFSVTPPVIRRTFYSKQQYGQPQCPITKPTLPPDNDPKWQEHWITSCFSQPC